MGVANRAMKITEAADFNSKTLTSDMISGVLRLHQRRPQRETEVYNNSLVVEPIHLKHMRTVKLDQYPK